MGTTIPISRPLLPTFDRLAPYGRQIDAARMYSNFGPMQEALLNRLASHFGVAAGQACLASSCTSALIGLILASAGQARPKRDLCIMPSYSFAATGAAATACGYTPFFCDIDPVTWSLDPDRVAALPELDEAALVLVVAPYGRPVDLRAWHAFTLRTGVPVVVDAAASFDSLDIPALMSTSVPVAISLHATKTFTTAEGGLVLCADTPLVRRAVAALNFGFEGSRQSCWPSINGKLSEYHAIIGLAEMDGWTEKRAGFCTVGYYYRRLAESLGLSRRIVADAEHASPYALYVAGDVAEAEDTMAALRSQGIESRRWYEQGMHAQPAFQHCPRERLAVTTNIAQRVVGLPFAVDMDAAAIQQVLEAIPGRKVTGLFDAA